MLHYIDRLVDNFGNDCTRLSRVHMLSALLHVFTRRRHASKFSIGNPKPSVADIRSCYFLFGVRDRRGEPSRS